MASRLGERLVSHFSVSACSRWSHEVRLGSSLRKYASSRAEIARSCATSSGAGLPAKLRITSERSVTVFPLQPELLLFLAGASSTRIPFCYEVLLRELAAWAPYNLADQVRPQGIRSAPRASSER